MKTMNNFSISKTLFVQIGFFVGILQGVEEIKRTSEREKNIQTNSSKIVDFFKTGWNPLTLDYQNGFDANKKGNILYLPSKTTMFSEDGDNVSIKNFSSYLIPKFSLADLIDDTKIPTSAFEALKGECQNNNCTFSETKLQKNAITAFGGNGSESGLDVGFDWIPASESDGFEKSYYTVNAHTVTAIGGEGNYAFGIRNRGITNTDRLLAIGGKGEFATGFLNEYQINTKTLVSIGGTKSVGFSNKKSLLNVYSITTIGGLQKYSQGLFNDGDIQTTFLLAIGGKDLNAPGLYNQGKIKAETILASTSQNKGIAITNDKPGVIKTKNLIVIGNGGWASLYNTKKATLEAQNIYLQGMNTIRNAGTITTQNLIINDFSSLQGNITFKASDPSLLLFHISPSNWEVSKPYLTINNGNLILNPNTSLQMDFSNENILGNNLSYDTIYKLVSIQGDGMILDNRSDKALKVSGISITPKTQTRKKEILFVFSKDENYNPFILKTKNPINEKFESLGIETQKTANFIQKINSFSPNALKILNSIIENNDNKGDFQKISIDEGLKNFDTNPQLLETLIKKTEQTLQEESTSIGIFSQKTIDYFNHQASNRINTIMLNRNNFTTMSFSERIQTYALASNSNTIIIPQTQKKNLGWANIGGSYYQNSSASLNTSSTTSLNISGGYDREIDTSGNADFILGGLINYAKSFYVQNTQKESFDAYSLGVYSNLGVKQHEIQWVSSGTYLLGNKKIHDKGIGISKETYANSNFAFNTNMFYKYVIPFKNNHSFKPLILGNYSFLHTPATTSKTFAFNKSHNHIFALGTGGEYGFKNASMGHIIKISGRYHILDINKSRAIAFQGSKTFINYDLNPSRVWFQLAYNAKFRLSSNFSLDMSLSGDISTAYDVLGIGNIGLNYVW